MREGRVMDKKSKWTRREKEKIEKTTKTKMGKGTQKLNMKTIIK